MHLKEQDKWQTGCTLIHCHALWHLIWLRYLAQVSGSGMSVQMRSGGLTEKVLSSVLVSICMCTDCQYVEIIQNKNLTRLTDLRIVFFFFFLHYFKSVP